MDTLPEPLPSCSLIGRTFTLFPGSNLFDYQETLESAEKVQLLNLNFDKEITIALGLNKKYIVPDNVLIAPGGTDIVAEDLLCTTGAALANDLVANPSLGHRYLGISTEGDGKFGHRVSFNPRSLFGLWSIGKLHYTAQFNIKSLERDKINADFIKTARKLPSWNENDPSARDAFAKFFAKWGTHVITGCSSGARYHLQVTRHDASNESKDNFREHIGTEYSSVLGVEGRAKGTSQYREYLCRRESKCSVMGGNLQLNTALARDPTSSKLFNQWRESIGSDGTHDITGVFVDSICNFLLRSPIQEHKEIAEKVQRASLFHSKFITARGVFKVKGIGNATGRVSSCEVQGAPGISLQAIPRPGTTVSALSRTMFEAQQLSGDQIECDVIMSAPPLAPIDVILVSSKKPLSQDNPFVFDLQLQIYPEGLSGAVTVVLGNKGNEGKVRLPNLTAIGDYVAE
ncbi:hypothetical protein BDV38DRAFT_265151 [Aspergillus pseudotamarii]|uniref:MACPF domain-containing protein n=1 Tax=Aspergillus pseudotamarii TaxID=132259 RepID=A0A5N6S942_ASPPS|nr:uncharacterized protein BDV38DRAFT_265151 [Aspergillus pseudotamarii]KAE8131206.1 hypothetical protein BDV38DRAFT_265151 [Aspergillus pseudotamarii]